MLFQLFYYPYLMRRAWKVKGISNKISVFLKGPGWAPGKPRLGYIEEIPDVRKLLCFIELTTKQVPAHVQRKYYCINISDPKETAKIRQRCVGRNECLLEFPLHFVNHLNANALRVY